MYSSTLIFHLISEVFITYSKLILDFGKCKLRKPLIIINQPDESPVQADQHVGGLKARKGRPKAFVSPERLLLCLCCSCSEVISTRKLV